MRLGRTTAVYFGSQVVISLSGFVATFAIARLLGAAVLGQYAVVVALLFWITIPVNAISSAINKRISEGEDPGSYVGAGAVLGAVVVGSLLVLVVAFGDPIDDYVGTPVSRLFALLIIGQGVFLPVLSALNGQKKVAHAGVLQAFEQLGRTGAQVALILVGYGLAGLVVGHAGALLVVGCLGLYFSDVRPALPSREHLVRIAEYARYSWLGTMQSRTFGWMDTIVLAAFVSSALIGIYEVAWTLASTLVLVSNAVQQTLFPELSELSTDENYERIHHFLNEGLVFVGVFAIPGLFGAAVLGPEILSIYRPAFERGAYVLLLLILARTVSAYGQQFVSAINAIDRPDVAFRINLVFVASNVLLNVVLIMAVGWYGAAVATLLSAAITLVLGYAGLRRLIGAPEVPYREIGRQLLASVVMAVALLGPIEVIPSSHYATVALVAFGGAVYVAVLLALSGRIREKAWGLVPFFDHV